VSLEVPHVFNVPKMQRYQRGQTTHTHVPSTRSEEFMGKTNEGDRPLAPRRRNRPTTQRTPHDIPQILATSTSNFDNVTTVCGRPDKYRTPIYDGRMVKSSVASAPGTNMGTDTLTEIK